MAISFKMLTRIKNAYPSSEFRSGCRRPIVFAPAVLCIPVSASIAATDIS